jgi:MoxR-like ATPase
MIQEQEERIHHFRQLFSALEEEVGQVIVGNREVVRKVLIAFFSGGHVLLESVPGLGKTLLMKSLSQAITLGAKRIQFTPDLMPSDIVGTEVLSESGGERYFEFKPGPVFTHIVLADEVNRATPKTQSAILEAMEEHQVSVFGQTHILPPPFFVMATQNPVEIEGTYPLPEAQLDRFLFKLIIYSPNALELTEILNRTTTEKHYAVRPLLDSEEQAARIVEAMKVLVREVLLAPPLNQYIAQLIVAATPGNAESSVPEVDHYLRYGPSPRGAQAMTLGAKVNALLDNRVNVSYEDIADVTLPALRHRCLLNFQAEAEGITSDHIIDVLLRKVKRR